MVGASGAGKTTLARLLPRSLDPTSGRVLLDGHDLRDLTRACLRRHVAVVLQETLLVDGTVRDNIAYGRPGASDEAIRAAAVAADADGFIALLPNIGFLAALQLVVARQILFNFQRTLLESSAS